MVLLNFWVEKRMTDRFKCRVCAFLVTAHKATVASDVCRENGSQSPIYPLFGHVGGPANYISA
jgi:hypothetical protein